MVSDFKILPGMPEFVGLEDNYFLAVWQPQQGGHVGFPSGAWPAHVRVMPDAVGDWLLGTRGDALHG